MKNAGKHFPDFYPPSHFDGHVPADFNEAYSDTISNASSHKKKPSSSKKSTKSTRSKKSGNSGKQKQDRSPYSYFPNSQFPHFQLVDQLQNMLNPMVNADFLNSH